MPERKAPRKSAGKSAAPGVPFQRGYDSRRGRGPAAGARNAGRPPDAWQAACRNALEEADGIGFVTRVMTGEAEQVVRIDAHGKPVLGRPRIRDRLNAVKLLLDYGYGKPTQDVELEDERPRQTGEQILAHVVELLPRIVAMLSAEQREDLRRRLAEQQAIEVLVSAQEAKDSGNGNGDETRSLSTPR